MRIAGGIICGRVLEVPPGVIRPAMDRMRESLFAFLGDISGKSFLDLFSGSGIMALEAASRSVSYIEAVEKDKQKRAVLLSNAAISENAGLARIICHFIPVELYVKRAKDRHFDYIFCDPPFNYKFKKELLMNIANSPLVHENSLLMMHHPQNEHFEDLNFPEGINGLKFQTRKLYGRSALDCWGGVA